jgi:hypothetical protein
LLALAFELDIGAEDVFDFVAIFEDIVFDLAAFDEVELLVVEFDGIVFAGVCAGVLAGIVFMLVLAGLVLALFVADSPQAIPSAPIARTAESAIAFFILFTNSYSFSKI